MTEKDLRLRFPIEELDLLLETEREEGADVIHQDQVDDNDGVRAIALSDETPKSLTSESEDNFSEDFQHDSDADNVLM